MIHRATTIPQRSFPFHRLLSNHHQSSSSTKKAFDFHYFRFPMDSGKCSFSVTPFNSSDNTDEEKSPTKKSHHQRVWKAQYNDNHVINWNSEENQNSFWTESLHDPVMDGPMSAKLRVALDKIERQVGLTIIRNMKLI